MIDFTRITAFDWDDGNSRKNSDKHAVSQLEAEQLFANTPLIIVENTKHSQMEPRYQALGQSNEGRPLFAAFTTREGGAKIRIISVREMSRKERAIYAQET